MHPVCPLCSPAGEDILWQDGFCRVVLVGDPDYPGFCRVILHAHVREMSDLAAAERLRLMGVVFQVEETLREALAADKINLASLGNVVPHLHWHVIPRFAGDRHFPDAVWAVPRRPPLAGGRNPGLRQGLAEALQKRLGPSRG